jgi:hypothetical protein
MTKYVSELSLPPVLQKFLLMEDCVIREPDVVSYDKISVLLA